MGAFLRDLRYALRQLRKAPGFTFVVVVMLALGIGANTAVFSVMNSVLMQLLPVARPQGLYYVHMANGEWQPPNAGNTGDSNTSFSLAWGTSALANSLYGSPRWWCLRMMARLRPGVSPIGAQQALEGTFDAIVRQTVGNYDAKTWKPLLDFAPARGIAGYNTPEARTPVLILMGLVARVLLIACTNLVMMVQAQNTAREHEFSLRMAIGAGRASIFRQLLCESLLLVAAGAGLGWMFAVSATRMLAMWSGIETGLSPDRTVLLVSRRSAEIGVRMALGAKRGQVLAMFMRESLWVLLFGVAAGIPTATFCNSAAEIDAVPDVTV